MVSDNFPNGWEWKKLEEVCEKPEYGYTTSAKMDGDGPLFLRTTDISNGEINWQSVPFCAEPPVDEERYRLKDGDILIARAGSVGAAVVIKKPPRSIFASYLIRFRPREELNPSYAGFFLKSNLYRAQLGSKMAGTTLPGVNATNLSKVKIPFLPLPTQKKIAAVLEKAEKLREWRKEADGLTDMFLKSTFLEMFGDPVKNPKGWKIAILEDVLSEDPQNGLYKPSTAYGEGTPILRIDSFYDGKITNMEGLKRLKCTQEEIEKYKLQIGDILINRVNSLEYLGKCGLVQNLIEDTVYESNMMRIRPKADTLNPTFLTMFLCTQYIKNQILSNAKKAVNQASINQKDVNSFKILVPPISLQNKFAEIVQEIEQIQEYQTQSRQHIDNLFNALMQRAFRGELEV